MPGKLDRKRVKEITGKRKSELLDLQSLEARKQDIAHVGSLDFLPSINKLDLGQNALQECGGLLSCTSLRWLNISHNQITSIKALSALAHLQVLNVSHNKLSGKLNLEGFPALCALIANDNAIARLKGLGQAKHLNTLVLKNNRISSLGRELAGCTALTKLSMAHNQLTELGDSLADCKHLAELRLSHNQLSCLPNGLAANSRLKIVEAGGNLIEKLAAVQVLQKLPHLASVSLKGCPLADNADYKDRILAHLPKLSILDGQKVSQKSRAPDPAPHAMEGKPGQMPAEFQEPNSRDNGRELLLHKEREAGQDQSPLEAEKLQGTKQSKPVKGRRQAKEAPRKAAVSKRKPASLHDAAGRDNPEASPKLLNPQLGAEDAGSLDNSMKDYVKPLKRAKKVQGNVKNSTQGAEVGAALQQGFLGHSVLQTDSPLAPGWD